MSLTGRRAEEMAKLALELWNVRALECQTCALARVQMHAPDRRQRSHGVSQCRALLASWIAPLSHSRRRIPEDGLCKLAQPHHQPRHHRSDSTAATATAEPRAAASPGCGGEGAMARTWWCAARRFVCERRWHGGTPTLTPPFDSVRTRNVQRRRPATWPLAQLQQASAFGLAEFALLVVRSSLLRARSHRPHHRRHASLAPRVRPG